MNFLGIGGLELVVVFLVALLVVGPVRLVQGAKTARKYMTELRRQREEAHPDGRRSGRHGRYPRTP